MTATSCFPGVLFDVLLLVLQDILILNSGFHILNVHFIVVHAKHAQQYCGTHDSKF